MATPSRAKQSYEDHRQEQVALKAAFLARFVQTYDLLDFNRIDETAVPWVQAAMNEVRPYRQQSANLAEQQYDNARRLVIPASKAAIPSPQLSYSNSRGSEVPTERGTAIKRPQSELERRRALRKAVQDGKFTLSLANVDWAEFDRAAERALLVTGPGELKKQSKMGRSEREAKAQGLKKASGAASKHVLNGGREVIIVKTELDLAAIGWVRVTDGDPCAFCALLSSRGPAYKTEQAAAFEPHDHCACVPMAVYSKSAPWPGRAREFRRLYDDNVAGQHSGADLLNAWRRFYERPQGKRRISAQSSARSKSPGVAPGSLPGTTDRLLAG